MENGKITIYPNPTTGELKIESEELAIKNVEIYDIFGRSLLKTQHYPINSQHSTQVDISYLTTGVYFVRICTESGEVIAGQDISGHVEKNLRY